MTTPANVALCQSPTCNDNIDFDGQTVCDMKETRTPPPRILLALVTLAVVLPASSALGQPLQGLLKSGLEKSNAGDFRGAIADLSRFIELFPTSAQAYHFRAEAKVGLQDFAGAVADFTKAVEFDPKNASVFIGRAGARWAMKDATGALATP
jgi:tetratricopeptide (TPR) repeat protein